MYPAFVHALINSMYSSLFYLNLCVCILYGLHDRHLYNFACPINPIWISRTKSLASLVWDSEDDIERS